MTSIDFYFNAADRLQVACRLAGKGLAQGKRMLIYAPDADTLARVDKTLWTWPAVGFVPHCLLDDPLAPETPVLLARDERMPEQSAHPCDVLLNLSQECPPHFASFERLLELVGQEDAEKEAGRQRYRFYKQRGYAIASHDLGAGA
jgi:DNA polymerase III subunit chi